MKKLTASLLIIAATIACQDGSKLTGDSNVYLEPGINNSEDNGTTDESGGTTDASPSLEVESFQATEDTSTDPTPGFGALSCGVDGHAISIEHHGVQAHCDQNWSDITIDTDVEFRFKIHYGFEPVNDADCTYNLIYTIDLQGCDLPPGEYQIIAHGEETTVDLSYVLGESEGE